MSHQGTQAVVRRNPVARAMQENLQYRNRREIDKKRKDRHQQRDAKRYYAD